MTSLVFILLGRSAKDLQRAKSLETCKGVTGVSLRSVNKNKKWQ